MSIFAAAAGDSLWIRWRIDRYRRRCWLAEPASSELSAGIQAFIDALHENSKPFVWPKPDEILASIARFAQRTADARATKFQEP